MGVLASGAFTGLDWAVLGGYFALLLVTGILLARREPSGSAEYFLAGRQMPVWAVAVSVLATSLSAATFIGGPQQAYVGNLTYLSASLGALLAIGVVAAFFVPAFYRANVSTVYELLEVRFGTGAKRAASAMFMVGRIFASGARVFIVAIPASMIVFGDDKPAHMVLAIGLLSVIAVVYTLVGGIRSIIWTDVIQTCVFVGAAGAAAWVLLSRIPLGAGELVGTLADAPGPGGTSKLTLLSLSTDPGANYTLLTAVIGFTLLNLGAYGTDHDLVQRMLTCRSAVRGSWSAVLGVLVGLPVTTLFMTLGLLLYVFYQRPEIMGEGAPSYPAPAGKDVFLTFILREMPRGMPGVMMAGLFAAGIGSLNSALNAMSATFLNDFYRPMRPGKSERHYLAVGRWGVAGWGAVLGGFACLCVWWYAAKRAEGQTLIDFALSVMGFAYAGLVAVFATAIFTRRGTGASAVAALAVGFVAVLAMEPWAWARWAGAIPGLAEIKLAYPWRLAVATAVATAVCCLPRGRGAARGGAEPGVAGVR